MSRNAHRSWGSGAGPDADSGTPSGRLRRYPAQASSSAGCEAHDRSHPVRVHRQPEVEQRRAAGDPQFPVLRVGRDQPAARVSRTSTTRPCTGPSGDGTPTGSRSWTHRSRRPTGACWPTRPLPRGQTCTWLLHRRSGPSCGASSRQLISSNAAMWSAGRCGPPDRARPGAGGGEAAGPARRTPRADAWLLCALVVVWVGRRRSDGQVRAGLAVLQTRPGQLGPHQQRQHTADHEEHERT